METLKATIETNNAPSVPVIGPWNIKVSAFEKNSKPHFLVESNTILNHLQPYSVVVDEIRFDVIAFCGEETILQVLEDK